MVMRVNNNFVGELSKRGQRLATTKGQREGHGFGLDSIEEIAQKHGGAMSFEAKDGVFVLNVVIPVPA